jgi:hypothetical protein
LITNSDDNTFSEPKTYPIRTLLSALDNDKTVLLSKGVQMIPLAKHIEFEAI